MASILELLAAALRAGLPPRAAIALAGEATQVEGPVATAVQDVVAAAAAGSPVGPVWGKHVVDIPELRLLAGAWTLSEDLGAPLAPAVDVAVETMRVRAAVRRTSQAESAGTRTSMGVVSLLPAAGPFVAVALGADPAAVYLSSPWGLAALAVGGVLTAAGWGWARLILRRAARPARVV